MKNMTSILIKEQHVSARRKANGLRSSIFSGAIWISGDREAEYLFSGHATELLDVVRFNYTSNESAKIYGMVAANTENGRYIWVYLYSHHHIWKCHSIANAYGIIERLKQYNKSREVEGKLYTKLKIASS